MDGYSGLYSELRQLEDSQFWTDDRILDLQMHRTRTMLTHAYNSTPFYRKRFDECGFRPDKLQNLSDLAIVPELTKQDICNHLDALTAHTFNAKDLKQSVSGGTTGVHTVFRSNKQCLLPKQAALLRFEKWAGWDIGEWMGLVWPATLELDEPTSFRSHLKNYFGARKIKAALTVIDEPVLSAYVDRLRKRQPTMIRGFPAPLTELARYIKDRGIEFPSIRGIVTTGEILYSQQRQIMEGAFRCRVFDSYRTRETGPIAQECQAHCGQHINAECLYVESVPRDEPLGQNNAGLRMGKLLVTDLMNFGMPFIRYAIGDMGVLSTKRCSCGRGLPMIDAIGGRLLDVVYTPEKKKIASVAVVANLVTCLEITNQVQFIQESFDELTIRMTIPALPPEVLQRQRQLAHRIFGAKMRITHEFVDTIPLQPSGKYAYVICNIPAEEVMGL